MSPTIYLETSVICHLTDAPSPNPITRACQQLTQLWWHTRCDPSYTFVSDYIHNEINASDPLRVLQRTQAIRHLAQHPAHEKMESIRELLISGGGLTARARTAAEHLSCAIFYNCEVLLTWDCANIANASKVGLMRALVNNGKYRLPELVTPFELMENEHETLWSRNSG
jgi:hypothetical protein